MKKIFIITGEYSGDIHASKVVSELKKIIQSKNLLLQEMDYMLLLL